MRCHPGPFLLALPLLATAASQEAQLPASWRPLAREIFAELIAIDSTHEKGSTAAAEVIAGRLRAAGFGGSELTMAGPLPHKQNLVARLRGKGKAKPVLYVVHLDVVPAMREDWSLDPFTFTEKDGWFYGRGTSDMKADVAAMATTLIRLKREGYAPDQDVVVAFTDDEERGSLETNGVKWLIEHRPELMQAALAINPDAGGGEIHRGRRTLLDLQTSEKVYLDFQLEATDRGGHSSVPHAGSPIYRLAAALGRIGAYEFPLHLSETTRGYFAAMASQETGALAADLATLGRGPTDAAAAARVARSNDVFAALMHTTCVATELAGGHARNALPQMARATVNCRILPDEPPEEIEATLRRLIDDPAISLRRLAEPRPSPPSRLMPAVVEPVTAVMKEMFPGVVLAPVLSTGASDSLVLRNAGIPTYGISGMFSDIDDVRAHGRDERIGVVEYYDGVEFAYRFVKALTGRRPPRTSAGR